jgi:amino acid adenylation domain-containing protein
MTVGQFLIALKQAGVQFSLDEGVLRYAAPDDLPAAMREEMMARKEEIRAVLQEAGGHTGTLEPIRPASRDTPPPLSFAQQRLWFLDQWQGGNSIYNEPAALHLEGPLNRAALERSLQEIVRRHEVFRTTYRAVSGQPQQIIHESGSLELPIVDLRTAPEAARALDDALKTEINRPFDLSRDPMLRAKLFRTGENEHVLTLVMHHIVADGWSGAVLIRELAALYSAFGEGRPSPLAPLPIQYADFAIWQRRPQQMRAIGRQLEYWKRQLAGAPDRIDLPTDFPRPAHETFHGARHEFVIAADLSSALRALAQTHGATLFMTLFAAFNVWLYRYSGQDDLVIGSVIANRDRQELEPLVGFFVNTLALRSDLSGDPSYEELLARVKKTSQDAFAHQMLAFERLVEVLSPQRSLSHAPLFQVMFSLQNTPTAKLELSGLRVTLLELPRDTAKFDLILYMRERDEELVGTWEYNTDLFLPGTIGRITSHFLALLDAIVAAPATAINRLPMLSAAERRQALAGWNDSATTYPHDACLQALFERQAGLTPEAPAVSGPDGCLSYRTLATAANRMAHRLLALGTTRGNPVGIVLERSTATVVAMLGILKAGGTYLPLDLTFPRERLDFMLNDSGARVLITDKRHAKLFADSPVTLLMVDDPEIEIALDSDPGIDADPLDPAYIIYTSGSTGQPKGVVAPHRAVIRLVRNTNYLDFTAVRRIGQVSNVSFDASTFEIWGALLNGAELVVIPQETLLSPDALAGVLRKLQVDALFLTTALFNQVARSRPDAFGGLDYLLVGGERMVPEFARRVLLSAAPPRRLRNVYGPTESTTFASWYPIASVPPGAVTIPIGRPIANTQLYVLDQALQPLPPGAYGELYIGGDGVALGYLNRPALTAERFLPNPFAEGLLYRTGDRVRSLADGNIEFAGRFDQQIKLRGYRIEPGEIETTLRSHPQIRDAVVQPREAGDGEKRLVAYLVTRSPDEEARDEQIAQWQMLFDSTYGGEVTTRTSARFEQSDPTRHFTGWESSYTGDPIPIIEMQEWLDRTVEEIEALRPERVLEIGCGTGLLLARLAPGRAVYHGTDFSKKALEVIETFRRGRPELAHVVLSRQGADARSGLSSATFDLVVLNSIVQYLPGIADLVRVLEAAAGYLKPGGRIYLGDLRNHDLQHLFHASVQGHQAGGRSTIGSLQEHIRQGAIDEEELLVAPAFFLEIARWLPELICERVGLKRGRFHNELTRFRYQVVLRKGAAGEQSASLDLEEPLPLWRSWEDERAGVGEISRILSIERPSALAFSAVPNARLAGENALLRALAEGQDSAALAPSLLPPEEQPALDPEALHELGRKLGYGVETTWSEGSSDGAFDVLFERGRPADPRLPGRPRHKGHAELAIESYANNPLLGKLARHLTPQLREFLKGKLPDYMVPAAYLFLPHWPLTQNGKVDRAALPEPSWHQSGNATRYVAPATSTERSISAIWQAVTGLTRIGIHDNFFEIGGHSLLATQIVSRLRDAFGIEFGLRSFFDKPTVAELAKQVDAVIGKKPDDVASVPEKQEEFLI